MVGIAVSRYCSNAVLFCTNGGVNSRPYIMLTSSRQDQTQSGTDLVRIMSHHNLQIFRILSMQEQQSRHSGYKISINSWSIRELAVRRGANLYCVSLE